MNGILLIDKPEGWTSSDVVCKLKGFFHQKRIGHSGTLDPMATGLLPVFIGKATKAVEFAENHHKVYEAGLRLGIETDTQDIWGTVITEKKAAASRDAFLTSCCSFIGESNQIPPMYSAVKIQGKKLYELARKGKDIERPARRISIESIELMETNGTDFLIRVSCSKGTYIRTLCHDIGQKLGTGACMISLRRIACGPFDVSESIPLIELLDSDPDTVSLRLIPVDALFASFPAYSVKDPIVHRIKSGLSFHVDLKDGYYRVYSPASEFLMLGYVENNEMHSRKNFFEV